MRSRTGARASGRLLSTSSDEEPPCQKGERFSSSLISSGAIYDFFTSRACIFFPGHVAIGVKKPNGGHRRGALRALAGWVDELGARV